MKTTSKKACLFLETFFLGRVNAAKSVCEGGKLYSKVELQLKIVHYLLITAAKGLYLNHHYKMLSGSLEFYGL